MKQRRFLSQFFLPFCWWSVLFVLGVGCRGDVERAGTPSATRAVQHPYRIVTTVGMVTDIVREVVGEKAQVVGLMGEGIDPHLYKPTRDDVRAMIDADVVIYSGLMLEGRMLEAFAKIAETGKPVFAVTDGLAPGYVQRPPDLVGHPDPHVWMDVGAWRDCMKHVSQVLSQYDEASASYYEQRAAEYGQRLDRLHESIREAISTIPKEQRVLITAHDAFGYFGRAYGIQVRAPQGISTESEASVEDINGLVEFISQRKIGALFVESSVNPKSIQAVIEGAAARGHRVQIGGELYSDAMGAPGTSAGSYIGMMKHNAATIVRGLGGEVPVMLEQGEHGER